MVITLQEMVDQSIRTVFTTDWFATSIMALLLSAALSALAWMLSSAFQSNELKGWARKELSEFIVTALILLLTVPLLMTITSITIAYAGSDPFFLAKSFLDKVEDDLTYAYSYLFGLNIVYSGASTLTIDLSKILSWLLTMVGSIAGLTTGGVGVIAGGLGGFGIANLAKAITGLKLELGLGAPFSMISNIISNILSGLVPFLLAFFVQKELLFFIQYTALPVLFPTGVLLRTFPITRKAGSTLIALSLTLFIVYPLTLAFASKMYDDTKAAISAGQLDYKPESVSIPFFRLLPDAGRYYLNQSDRFLWEVFTPLNYSIWGDVSCNGVGSIYESKNPQNPEPPPEDYMYWKITERTTYSLCPSPDEPCREETMEVSKCYRKIQKGEVNSSGSIEYLLNNENIFPNNKVHSIILVTKQIREREVRIVSEEVRFYLGDPCQENLWSILWCKLKGTAGESPINDISYLNLAVTASMGGLEGAARAVGQITGYTVTNYLATPYAAGMAFYGLTDVLPNILFPYVFTIFVFIVIIFVTISTFRSVSTTLGGETKIIELGRLV
ncbi:MAG: hypothetical protein QXF07_00095 [Candidatus Micrarchaeia archaeon]